jgi:hypothetical protein
VNTPPVLAGGVFTVACQATTQEVESTKTMVDSVEDRFGIKPQCLIGDTAYGTAAMLNWTV